MFQFIVVSQGNIYEDDPVEVYLREISEVPLMTRDQELECIGRMRAGGDQADLAMKDLVEVNLRLVVSIAQKYPGDGLHILDLIQTGNQALMAAVRAFADSDADNFSAYAVPFIENAIIHAITTAGS